MIDSVSFILNFHKFSNLNHIAFHPGLHVIYGESGCGKSQFVRSLAGYKTHSESNFLFSDISIPESIQIVFQNPENQILAHTLESELAFAPECLSLIPNVLQKKLKNLKSQLPFIHNWDREIDQIQEQLPIDSTQSKSLMLAFSLAVVVLTIQYSNPLFAYTLSSTLLLTTIHLLRNRLHPETRRALADLSLLTPLAILL